MCVSVCVCIYVCPSIYVSVFVYLFVCVCVCISVYVCTCLCASVHLSLSLLSFFFSYLSFSLSLSQTQTHFMSQLIYHLAISNTQIIISTTKRDRTNPLTSRHELFSRCSHFFSGEVRRQGSCSQNDLKQISHFILNFYALIYWKLMHKLIL